MAAECMAAEMNVGRELTVTFGAVSMSGGAVRVVDEKLRPLWASDFHGLRGLCDESDPND